MGLTAGVRGAPDRKPGITVVTRFFNNPWTLCFTMDDP